MGRIADSGFLAPSRASARDAASWPTSAVEGSSARKRTPAADQSSGRRSSLSFTLTWAEVQNEVSMRPPLKPLEWTRTDSERESLKPVVTERMASDPLTDRAASSSSRATRRRCSGVTVG